jgi:HK97 family phage prohead protease
MAERPYETRTVTADIELRDAESTTPTLEGYASTFNDPYPVGFFRERIHPDAFKRTLSGSPDVRLLVDHEGQPLARTKSGTLQLSTDSRGLAVKANLDPADPDVQRLLPKMRRGDLDQMSFAFRVPADGDVWDYSGDMPDRTIREANLSGGDVSVVTYPANENASVSVRARDDQEAAFVLADAMLREARSGRAFDEVNRSRFLTALTMMGLELNAQSVRAIEPTDDESPQIPPASIDAGAREAIRLTQELRARRA